MDVGLQRRSISPLIYGLSQGSPAQAQRMGVSLRRLGGNQFLRYNFANDTSNTAGDGYHYRNFVLAPDAGDTFSGQFVDSTRSAGLVPWLQLPVMGFVSKDSPAQAPFTCSFPVSVYGPQQSVDPLDPDCGNGVFTDGGPVTGNSPFDTSVATDAGYVRDVVAALVARFGQARDGGVSIYQLGNQPGLWHETHRDVHPGRATYEEVKAQLREYGLAVKQADPLAKTAGPAAWGWLEYFDSANFDRQNYNDLEFLPYYLQQAALIETASGKRVLDYLDIHAYPQGEVANPDGGVSLKVVSDDDSPTLNAMRLRSTRVLWDPTYTSETWEICCYDSVQRIIPRVRTWIAQQYPGTGLSISSYGWGGLSHVNGALTQAEVLGILGREGVDVATLDEVVPDNGVAEDAFALFRNFDGAGSQFGATSVLASSDDASTVSAFAAHDASGRVTLVLINKDPNFSQTANVNFVGVGSMGPWRAYGFGAGGRLGPAGSGSVSGGALSVQLPAYTAWIVEFLPSGDPTDGGMMGSGGGAGGGGGGSGGGSAGGGSAGGGSAGGGSAGG
ncbi:MAG: glycoside hydrolase family 44 protein, partial [Myxococcaceae bacterium]|nr:glycoside hydrolase family 44 protein [Myxococcaceae bacterium]